MNRLWLCIVAASATCPACSSSLAEPAELVSTSPAGAACPDGGTAISTGRDDNGDGVLEASEVTSTSYVCAGAAGSAGSTGSAGSAGATELVAIVPEPPGANCAFGGDAIEVGVDTNGDGVLEPGEVTSTTYDCTAAPVASLIRVVVEPPGANCADGGAAIEAGVDTNGDGTLEQSEVTTTSYVCEPPSTLQQLVRVVADTSGACPTGGKEIDVGFDLDGDGVLEPGEITSITHVCNGTNTISLTAPEPPGPHCAAGGTAIELGIDLNGDGVLEANEVTATSFVCNPSTIIEGNVVIHTQGDVDALAGITQITGTLSFDAVAPIDAELPLLERVGGISCGAQGALPCTLAALFVPKLQAAVDVTIVSQTLSPSFPALTTLDTATFSGITGLSMPNIGTANILIGDVNITTLSLPLTSGELDIVEAGPLVTIDLPAFTTGTLHVFSGASPPSTISAPVFQSGNIDIEGSFRITELSFPALVHVGTLKLSELFGLETLDVPNLTSASELEIEDTGLPTCAADALVARLGFPPGTIDHNNDAGTCP